MQDMAVATQLQSSKTEKIVLAESSKTAIPIAIYFNSQFFIQSISNMKDLNNEVDRITDLIENLAKKAFFENDKNAWSEAQNILYYWNRHDINRVNRLDLSSIAEELLRKKLINIEQKSMKKFEIDCFSQFSPEKAVKELRERALSHRINSHPLLNEMSKNGLPLDIVRIFINNYYVNNRLFHLFIITLCLFTPLERRTELANNFFDELGGGDNQLAHPVLFYKNFNTIGAPSEIVPLAESLYLTNAKLYAAYLLGNYHYGMGGFGCIELTMPEQMKKILKGLQLSGLPREDLEFWDIHITIDIGHGKAWFNEMLDLISTPEEAESCLNGGMYLLEARARMYDGIWNMMTR